MKKSKLLAVFLFILMVFSVWIRADSNDEEDLSEQIKALKEQLEKLEKRVKILEKMLQAYAERPRESRQFFPRPRKIPDGWKEFEYEGWTYYLIPLNKNSQKR